MERAPDLNAGHGEIALVGSGEYLEPLRSLEKSLLQRGGSVRYVQIPTAAGQESDHRLRYWKELGATAAHFLQAEQVYLPIYTRDDAMRQDFADLIDGAGLIYLSGGDPHYLARTILDTPVHEAIMRNWKAGSSLAGCSAGAMAMGSDVPHFRHLKREGEPGFSVVPHIRTIPHFDKFFKWIPEVAAQKLLRAPEGTIVLGIDEDTAAVSRDRMRWRVHGRGRVHVLNGDEPAIYSEGEEFSLTHVRY